MSVSYFSVLRSPMVTERSTMMKEKFNQYVFKVHPDSTKKQIMNCIEDIFKVKVEKVRTANFKGKASRLVAGRAQGRRSDWKKAIVTLQKGQEIKFEEPVQK